MIYMHLVSRFSTLFRGILFSICSQSCSQGSWLGITNPISCTPAPCLHGDLADVARLLVALGIFGVVTSFGGPARGA
jgi:hypothetical protein